MSGLVLLCALSFAGCSTKLKLTKDSTSSQSPEATSDTPPTQIAYDFEDYAFILNTASETDTPTTDGTNVTYSISPALPAGLSINTSTGKISGTPTASSYNTSYTVTATNNADTYDKVITITTLSGFQVNTFTDGTDDSVGNGICFSTAAGGCSLRAAVQESNSSTPTQNLILLSTGTYTITSAIPTLTDSIVIRGQGMSTTVIQPSVNYAHRALYSDIGSLDLQNLSIKHAGNTAEAGAILLDNGSTALIKNVTFEDNKVTTFAVNNPGGGAVSAKNTTATFDQVVFKDNNCLRNGGGMYTGTGAVITVKNSLFTGNSGKYGSALIAHGSTVTLTNSTLYGNHSSAEGTFANDGGTVAFKNVTMVSNDNSNASNTTTAGLFLYDAATTTTLSNSIIYGNINLTTGQEQNCKRRFSVSRLGTITSLGGNFIGDSLGDGAQGGTFNNECLTFFGQATDRTATDPLLVAGAPTANGGPTDTIKLQSTSAAIDGGEDSQCESLDQRGETRPAGNHCDSGALEMQATD